jgi:serine/threonine protein phosphatase PrpC
MLFSVAHHSLIGARSSNQDRLGYAERDNAILLVLADGLGGYEGGELAAETLVDTFVRSFEKIRHREISDPAAYLVLTTVHAHTLIKRRSQQKGLDVISPRTTCIVCLVQNGLAYWAHVGDSRLYLCRNRHMHIRTRDHSVSEELVKQGMISEDQDRDEFSQLTRCVGGIYSPRVSLGAETRLQTGDILMLCSDGVWRELTNAQIEAHITAPQIEDGVERLLAHAQKSRPEDCDNMSVLLFRWEDAVSTAEPLYGLSTPSIDQDNLWNIRRDNKTGQDTKKKVTGTGTENLDNKLADIESFVDKIDDMF